MEDKNCFFALHDFPEGKMHKRVSAWDFYGKIDFPLALWISAISPTLILRFFAFPEEKNLILIYQKCVLAEDFTSIDILTFKRMRCVVHDP